MKRQKKTAAPLSRRAFFLLALVIGAAFLGTTFLVSTLTCRAAAAKTADKTLDFMRAQIARYDGYNTDNRTKSLVRLLDKLQALGDLLELSDTDESALLAHYAGEQRISAIALLGADGAELSSFGETARMADALASDTVAEIYAYPKKCVLTQFSSEGETYDFVAVSRRDAPGLLAACVRKTDVAADGGELSLHSLFADYTFDMNGAAVVTDDEYILSANREILYGRPITDVDLLVSHGMQRQRDGLYRATYQGRTWYGKQSQMLDYYLYVYFPSAEVFSSRTVFWGYGLLAYLVLWLCFSYLRQRSTRAALERELAYQREVERSAADAERANAAKTGFLRRMSHDLRTPIHGIRGMVELSRRFPDDEAKQEECRDKIMDASGFLLELVNSMLDMSKLESGEVQLESRPFDLGALLDSLGVVVESEAASRGVRYRCDRSGLRHPALIGSPLHVQQVLQNITVNAVKYNRPGGSVTLTCRETECAGGEAEIEFVCADTGVGMSAEFQSRAFEPFAQESDSSGGIGLGLAIARELTEQMGGAIAFTSSRGVGTTFTVTLRFPLDAAPAAAPEPEDVSLEGCRVLIAEDNELNREIAEALLQSRGAETVSAADGREAVARFAASAPGEFDVILMDVLMPEMDGLDAARAIRVMDRPDAKTVPILAMTANAFADDVSRSLAAGMNAHLTKPLGGAALAAAVRKYWKGGGEP